MRYVLPVILFALLAPAAQAYPKLPQPLPPVKGNPGAVYFDIANAGPADVAFRTADVAGAQGAMIHAMDAGVMGDVVQQPVKSGETVKFEPGGRHIMAMGLPDTLKPGDSTEVTLHFVALS